MKKSTCLAVVLLLTMASIMMLPLRYVKADYGSNILYVGGSGPGNYTGIQAAIDNASDGDTIFVFSGIYYENITIKKSIRVVGENLTSTVIDSFGKGDPVVLVISTSDVEVTNFTIQNSSGEEWDEDVLKICNSSFVTISNNIIKNGPTNIYLENVHDSRIIKNHVLDSFNAILVKKSSYNEIKDNVITHTSDQMSLFESHHNIISNNSFSKIRIDTSPGWFKLYDYTLRLIDSDYNIIIDNTFINGGIFCRGHNNIIENNTLNKKNILHLRNLDDKNVDHDETVGQIIIEDCRDLTVKNYNFSDLLVGITLINSTRITLKNITLHHNLQGLTLINSYSNIVENSTFYRNGAGLNAEGNSSYNLIKKNNFTRNIVGVCIISSSNNNRVSENVFRKGSNGITIDDSAFNIVESNFIKNPDIGIILMRNSDYNIFSRNAVRGCGVTGVYVKSRKCDGNTFCGNAFYNNGFFQAIDDGYNKWDNGTKGNYWNNYRGKDKDGDGVGDTPMIIPGMYHESTNRDNYPLMEPHDHPMANFTYVVDDKTVFFDATSSYAIGERYIISYKWDFGDGNISYGENVTHRYSERGFFKVKLTIIDNKGLEDIIEKRIYVGESEPPVVYIEKPSRRHIYIFGKEKNFPVNIPWVIGRMGILVHASDTSGIDRVEFYVDNKLKHIDYVSPYTWTFNEKSFGRVHTIKVMSYDNAGNSATQEIKTRVFILSR